MCSTSFLHYLVIYYRIFRVPCVHSMRMHILVVCYFHQYLLPHIPCIYYVGIVPTLSTRSVVAVGCASIKGSDALQPPCNECGGNGIFEHSRQPPTCKQCGEAMCDFSMPVVAKQDASSMRRRGYSSKLSSMAAYVDFCSF
jgi:hypothetical protein